jgi:hypothetical protein
VRTELLEPPAIVRESQDLATLAAKANAAHAAVEKAARESLEHARAAGESLLKAKAQCGHGKWLAWLKANVECSPRTAQAYMQICRKFDELKCATVAHLGFREALALLAAPGEEEAQSGSDADLRDDAEPDEAGRRLAANPWPDEPFPELDPACSYLGIGEGKSGQCVIELDPHPDDPSYWTFAVYHPAKDGGVLVEYCGRGMKLNRTHLFCLVDQDFRPYVKWTSLPARPKEEIDAISWYAEAFQAMLADPTGFRKQQEALAS